MSKTEQFNFAFNTNKIDITDPCYNKDVWCRTTANIIPGDYSVIIEKENCGSWGERNINIAIVLSSKYYGGIIQELEMYGDVIGGIGVDAGLAGFFDNKPDYTDKEWGDLCDNVFLHKDFGAIDCGVWCRSGYGDGAYDVLGLRDSSGSYYALMIEFININEEDDEE